MGDACVFSGGGGGGGNKHPRHGLSAISSGRASSRENGAGSIRFIAIPPEAGYDATFRSPLETFRDAH